FDPCGSSVNLGQLPCLGAGLEGAGQIGLVVHKQAAVERGIVVVELECAGSVGGGHGVLPPQNLEEHLDADLALAAADHGQGVAAQGLVDVRVGSMEGGELLFQGGAARMVGGRGGGDGSEEV